MTPQNDVDKLSKALKNNECARVEELIAKGADVNQADAEGTKPLQHVVKTGCMCCLTLLLNNGADIRATATMDVPSAVSIAASNGHIDALKCLLNNCADDIINGENEKQPPLHYARFNGKIDAMRYIVEKYPHTVHSRASAGAKHCTSLHAAAESDNVECMEILIEHGAEIKAVDADGATILTYAANSGKLAALKFLHDRGVSAIAADQNGWLPLHSACLEGHVDVARVLLEKHPGHRQFHNDRR